MLWKYFKNLSNPKNNIRSIWDWMCEKKRTLQAEVNFPGSEPFFSIRIQPQDKKRPKRKIYGHHHSYKFPCCYPFPLEPFDRIVNSCIYLWPNPFYWKILVNKSKGKLLILKWTFHIRFSDWFSSVMPLIGACWAKSKQI